MIVKEMVRQQRQLEVLYGEEPEGFVLGPLEYIAFCEELTPLKMCPEASILNINRYAGIPVYIKSQPGIELLISKDLAINMLAKKTLEK